MAFEMNSAHPICTKCGTAYGKRSSNFLPSYAPLYKGIGYMSVCKNCVDSMYNHYYALSKDEKIAARQCCRKLDIYWDEGLFETSKRQSSSRTIMSRYISKSNTAKYVGKSYDDTLKNEGSLWTLGLPNANTNISTIEEEVDNTDLETTPDIPDDIIAFWGAGYTSEMYEALEQRKAYWMSGLPENIDIGTEAIIKQICSLELDINRDRAAGRSVDKSINALNTLLGSACLKPAQKKDDTDANIDNTPFGVWIRRWEDQRPIPDPDPELQDVDGIIRYITIWFFGHLCKMLGIRNSYCKLYEDELAKMRVDRPEYDDEDDETMFNDIFGDNDTDISPPFEELEDGDS